MRSVRRRSAAGKVNRAVRTRRVVRAFRGVCYACAGCSTARRDGVCVTCGFAFGLWRSCAHNSVTGNLREYAITYMAFSRRNEYFKQVCMRTAAWGNRHGPLPWAGPMARWRAGRGRFRRFGLCCTRESFEHFHVTYGSKPQNIDREDERVAHTAAQKPDGGKILCFYS